MRTVKITMLVAAAITTSIAHAQTNTFPTTGNAGVGTLAPAANLQVIGTSRFGAAANYGSFDGIGNLSFTGTSGYRVSGNRYAFQYSGNPNYGLFFNSTNLRYEFRDGAALPVFYVGANDGNAVFTGGLRVSNSTLTNAGNIRWTGTDFQGYNGTAWLSLTAPLNRWGINGNSGTSASDNFIGTTDNAGLAIRTNNTERIRVQSDGDVGIGTTVPDVKLHVVGGTDVTLASGGYIVAGDVSGSNIAIDANEIQRRNAGAAATLFLNNAGGDVQTGAALKVGGNISATTSGNGMAFFDGQTIKDNVSTNTLELLCHADFTPDNDLTHNVGNSSFRWLSVWAQDGTINTSDARDKQNIRDLDYGLKDIMKLRAVKFNWKNATNSDDKIGLIAQELKTVLPEVVRDYEIKKDEVTGKTEKVPAAHLGVMYADIIPVLIKGMQQQQQMIEEQNKKIEALTQQVNNSNAAVIASSDASDARSVNISGASLEQNAPNPFNSNTVIRYNVPASASAAQIVVTNTNGNTVKTFALVNKGSGSVSINAGELAAGTYYYTLIVAGKKIDSKKMLLIK
ncbi:MAG TPA: tail fiber domain-containing protein [Panacibacter sp.]|nr:tail fiber domain-containing protein [Panacibacter sp.]HNP46277.1 tail fiber domain-containing protein [Panacibacter sp.]